MTSPRRRLRERRDRALATLMAVLFAITSGVALTASASTPAAAGDPPATCIATKTTGNNPTVDGSTSLMGTGASQPLWADPVDKRPVIVEGRVNRQLGVRNKDATLYEQMGMSGTKWSTTVAGRQDKFDYKGSQEDDKDAEWECDLIAPAMNVVSNTMFDLAKVVTGATITLRQTAANPQPFINLMDRLGEPVETIRTRLYAALAAVALMVTGLLVVLSGVKTKSVQREAIRAGGMALVLLLVGTVLTLRTDGLDYATSPPKPVADKAGYYLLTSSALNKLDDLNGALASLLLSEPEGDDICAATGEDVARRSMDCQIYKLAIFDPWAKGQFGETAAQIPPTLKDEDLNKFNGVAERFAPGSDLRIAQLSAQGVSNSEVNAKRSPDDVRLRELSIQRDPSDSSNFDVDNPTSSQGVWNMVREAMYQQHHDDFTTWRGADVPSRLSAAVTAIFMALLIGSLMVVTSVLLLLYNCMLVVLFFVLPLVALVGIVPPAQKIFKGWMTMVLKSVGMIAAFGIAQILALFLMSKVIATGLPVGIQAMLLLFIAIGVMKAIRKAQTVAPATGFDAPTVSGGDIASTGGKVFGAVHKSAPVRRPRQAVNSAVVAGVTASRQRQSELKKMRPDMKRLDKDRKAKLAQKVDEKFNLKEQRAVAAGGDPLTGRQRRKTMNQAKAEAGKEVESVPSKRDLLGKENSVFAAMARGAKGGVTAKTNETVMGIGAKHGRLTDEGLASLNERRKELAEAAEKVPAGGDLYQSVGQRARAEMLQARKGNVKQRAMSVGSSAKSRALAAGAAVADTKGGRMAISTGRGVAQIGSGVGSGLVSGAQTVGGRVSPRVPGTDASHAADQSREMEHLFRREEYQAYMDGQQLATDQVDVTARREASFKRQQATAQTVAANAQKRVNAARDTFSQQLQRSQSGEISATELNNARRDFESKAKAATERTKRYRARVEATQKLRVKVQ